MKQKVVIKVPMNGDKSRNKATKVVAPVLGLLVISRLLRKHSDSHSIATKNIPRAMIIAIGLAGVESVSLKGQKKNKLEVIGKEVDPVKLTKVLSEKIGFAEIMDVSAVDEKKAETKTENDPNLNYYYSYGGSKTENDPNLNYFYSYGGSKTENDPNLNYFYSYGG